MAAESSSCASHLMYYIVLTVNLRKYRVSFVDFYFAFPTNFRVVFLPHTNTVILLEKYCCGTWLSSFYIKSFYIITVPGWPVVHLKIL